MRFWDGHEGFPTAAVYPIAAIIPIAEGFRLRGLPLTAVFARFSDRTICIIYYFAEFFKSFFTRVHFSFFIKDHPGYSQALTAGEEGGGCWLRGQIFL